MSISATVTILSETWPGWSTISDAMGRNPQMRSPTFTASHRLSITSAKPQTGTIPQGSSTGKNFQ